MRHGIQQEPPPSSQPFNRVGTSPYSIRQDTLDQIHEHLKSGCRPKGSVGSPNKKPRKVRGSGRFRSLFSRFDGLVLAGEQYSPTNLLRSGFIVF